MSPWFTPTASDSNALLRFRSGNDPYAPGARAEPWAREVDHAIHKARKTLRKPSPGISIYCCAAGLTRGTIDTVMVIEDRRKSPDSRTEADFSLGILAVRNTARGTHRGRAALQKFDEICAERAREYGLRAVVTEAQVMTGNEAMNALLKNSGWRKSRESGDYTFWVKVRRIRSRRS